MARRTVLMDGGTPVYHLYYSNANRFFSVLERPLQTAQCRSGLDEGAVRTIVHPLPAPIRVKALRPSKTPPTRVSPGSLPRSQRPKACKAFMDRCYRFAKQRK